MTHTKSRQSDFLLARKYTDGRYHPYSDLESDLAQIYADDSGITKKIKNWKKAKKIIFDHPERYGWFRVKKIQLTLGDV